MRLCVPSRVPFHVVGCNILNGVLKTAKDKKLKTHLDGSRIFNAADGLKVPLKKAKDKAIEKLAEFLRPTEVRLLYENIVFLQCDILYLCWVWVWVWVLLFR